MVALGGLALGGIGQHRPIGPVGWLVGGLLIVSGALLFLRRPIVFWPALAAALLTLVTGVLAYLGHPELALPVPWGLSVAMGLLLCVRVTMVRSALLPRRRRAFLPDEPEPGEPAGKDRPA
jgi:hypothetical protein